MYSDFHLAIFWSISMLQTTSLTIFHHICEGFTEETNLFFDSSTSMHNFSILVWRGVRDLNPRGPLGPQA